MRYSRLFMVSSVLGCMSGRNSVIDGAFVRSWGVAGSHCGVTAEGHAYRPDGRPAANLMVAIIGGGPLGGRALSLTDDEGRFSVSTYGVWCGKPEPALVFSADNDHMLCAVRAKRFRYSADNLEVTVHGGDIGCTVVQAVGPPAPRPPISGAL